MSQLLPCIASKICIKEGRVYHRRFRVKLKAIWGRQKVIDAIQIALESDVWSQISLFYFYTKLGYGFLHDFLYCFMEETVKNRKIQF